MSRKSLLFGSAIKTVSAWDIDSDVGWTSLTGDENAKGIDLYFRYVPWLYRAVKDRAANVGALPWAILQGDDNEIANSAEWSDDKPADLDWLDNPRRLFAQIEQSLAMTSKAYIFLECNPSGYIKGAKYCAPNTITELYDKNTGEIIGYERTVKGRKMTCAPASADWDPKYPGRIVAIYDADYQTEIGPAKSSAALAALNASGVLYSTDKFIEQFFSRGAIKASVLSVESGSQAEHERLQAWWDDVIAGVKNAWSAIVMRGKVNAPVVIGQGTEGLENDSLTTSKRQDIATALGIPESRLWSSAANYATRDADEKAYFRGTIIPEFDLIAEAFNGQVFTANHKLDGYRIESQPETLDVFQAEESERAGSLQQLTTAGVPLKLAMEILGYDLTEEQWALLEEEEAEPEPVPTALVPFAGQNNPPVLPEPEPVEVEEPEEPEPTRSLTADMLKELEIWQRKSIKAFKAGLSPDCEFAVVTLSDEMAAEIKVQLQAANSIDAIKDVFLLQQDNGIAVEDPWYKMAERLTLALEGLMDSRERVKELVRMIVSNGSLIIERKTLEQYRARLWGACVRLFNGGRDAAFEASFIRSIDQQLTQAWDAGADSIGVEPDEYTDADITIRDAIINNETEFIEGLMNDIQTAKDSGMERDAFDKQFGARCDLWSNRWNETVNRARMQMGSKERYVWRLGQTEEHCETCSKLNGIVAFGYEWDEARIQPQAPPNEALSCSGWRCDCSLEPTTRRRTGRALDRLIEIRL